MPDQLTIPEPESGKRPVRSAADLTADLRNRLRVRFSDSRRYAVLEEVANATGAGQSRSCDLLVINMWPSDGIEWHGHEIKASRSDWLREIKDPDKADAFALYCDRWWVVAADRAIVQPGELRDGWGLLVPSGDGLRVAIGAAKRDPKPATREFLAAIMRRFVEAQHRALELAPEGQERREMQARLGEADRQRHFAESRAERAAEQLQELQASVAAFREASGLDLDRYNGKPLGEDVARLRSLSVGGWQLRRFERLAEDARDLAEVATRAATAAKELSERPEDEDAR